MKSYQTARGNGKGEGCGINSPQQMVRKTTDAERDFVVSAVVMAKGDVLEDGAHPQYIIDAINALQEYRQKNISAHVAVKKVDKCWLVKSEPFSLQTRPCTSMPKDTNPNYSLNANYYIANAVTHAGYVLGLNRGKTPEDEQYFFIPSVVNSLERAVFFAENWRYKKRLRATGGTYHMDDTPAYAHQREFMEKLRNMAEKLEINLQEMRHEGNARS